MQIWSTKYCLSQGIELLSVEESETNEAIVCYEINGWKHFLHGEGKDWHRTREAAIDRADSVRIAKILSLKKQLAKLEKMRFG